MTLWTRLVGSINRLHRRGNAVHGAAPAETGTYWALLAIVLLGVGVPLLYLIWRSVTADGPGSAFTLDSYRELFTSPELRRLLLNTALLVAVSVTAATSLAVTLAFLTVRTNLPLARMLGSVGVVPLIIPPFVLVIGWVMLAAPNIGLLTNLVPVLANFEIYSPIGVMFVLTLYLVPYVFSISAAGFASADTTLEQAARVAGAGPLRTFLSITLRLNLPSIAAGMLLITVLAAESFIIPHVLGRRAGFGVLSTSIWRHMSLFPTNTGVAAAEGLLLTVLGVGLLVLQRKALSRGSHATVEGRGRRLELWNLGRWRVPVGLLVASYMGVAAVLPLLAILVVACLSYWTGSITLEVLTLDNFRFLFGEHQQMWKNLVNTLVLSLLSASLIAGISVVFARRFAFVKGWGTRLAEITAMAPLGIPGIAFAVGVFVGMLNLLPSAYASVGLLAFTYTIAYLPMGLQPIVGGVRQMGSSLEAAARVHGASWFRTLRTVTIPVLRPVIASAWVLVYILVLRDISRTVLLYGPKSATISIGMLDMEQQGLYPELAAYSVVLMVLGIVPLALIRFWLTRVNLRLERTEGGLQ